MRLLKLNISNFGLFHNKTINLSPGLNLIYGRNEAGKSTIHSFIKGMLFGIEKTRGRPSANDMYDKYQPWDRPGSYDGSLEFEFSDNIYHVYRNFDKNYKETILTHVLTGREIDRSQIELQELLGGLTKSGYEGTISIGQLAARTEDELIYLVQNHIANLTMSKSEEIDVKKALEYLKDKHKEYDLKALKQEIEDLKDKIKVGKAADQQVGELTEQLFDIQVEEGNLSKERNKLTTNKYISQEDLYIQFHKFPVIKTKYGYYLEGLSRKEQLQETIEKVQRQIDSLKGDVEDNGSNKDLYLVELKSSLASISNYREEYNYLSKEKYEYKSQNEDELTLARKRNLNITSPIFVFGSVLTLLTYTNNDFISKLGISLAVISVIIFVALNLVSNNKKLNLETEYDLLDQELEKIKESILDILQKHSVNLESELKLMYEESLKEQITLNQLEKELQDLRSEYLPLEEKIKTLKDEILDYIIQFSFVYPEDIQKSLELKDEIIGILDEYITDESLKLNHYEEKVKPRLKDLSIKKERIKWEIELLEGNEEDLLENQERYDDLLKKQEIYEVEIGSINLAIATIEDLATEIHDTFGVELNNLASILAKEITGGRYEEIKIDEKLRIRTQIKDQYQTLERLSTGTIEQLYFSLRLAIADLVYGRAKVPILLDDTFAYYDDQRLKSTLKLLSKEKDRQILLFTCHTREKDILDDLDANYNFIDLGSVK